MKVTPIIAPAVDWQAFVQEVHSVLGRSPTASLAMAGLKPGLLRTVAPSLGEFQKEGTAAIPFMKSRDSDHVLSMLYVSFLIEAPWDAVSRLHALSFLSFLTPEDSDGLSIVTGCLFTWRHVVIANARLDVPAATRAIVNEIFLCLNRAGLGDMFADCDSRKHTDGTILIREKKSGR